MSQSVLCRVCVSDAPIFGLRFRCGEIFETSYLERMFKLATRDKRSERLRSLLSQMISESECAASSSVTDDAQGAVTDNTPMQGIVRNDAPTQGAVTDDTPTQGAVTDDAPTQCTVRDDAPDDRPSNGGVNRGVTDTQPSNGGVKRGATDSQPSNGGGARGATDGGAKKRPRGARHCSDNEAPMFYYNVHKRKVKGVDLPK